MNTNIDFVQTLQKLFLHYKSLGEKSMATLNEQALFWKPNEQSNSVGIIVKHLSGNMLSRFTDFYTSDGEKPWRNRDDEFIESFASREEINTAWNKGWDCLLNIVNTLTPDALDKIVFIRNEGHTVLQALMRQLAHYSYHVGQIVIIAKEKSSTEWQSLSIAPGKSNDFNEKKFSIEKSTGFFTDKETS